MRLAIPTGNRLAMVTIVLSLAAGTSGCRLCEDCGDVSYTAYGGAWQRVLRNEGRVGSVFEPAGGKTPELVGRDVPPGPAELERRRQRSESDYLAPDRSFRDQDSAEPETEEAEDSLQDRQLDEIKESDRERQLRDRQLEDIKTLMIPAPPMQ